MLARSAALAPLLALAAGLVACGQPGAESAKGGAGQAAGASDGGGGASAASSSGSSGSEPTAGTSSGGGGSGSGADQGGGGGQPSVPGLPGEPMVYVSGTGAEHNIWLYTLDAVSGALGKRGEFEGGAEPSYLALAPARTHLYVSNDQNGVTALAIEADGALGLLNHQPTSKSGPSHLAVDPAGKRVIAASYGGGNAVVFPLEADGRLAPESQSVDFGAGSHAHCVAFDASGKLVFVPTHGSDQIQQLLLSEQGLLSANDPAFAAAPAGAGPRHIALHPNGSLAFVVNENDSTVSSYQVSPQGALTLASSASTLPADFTAKNTGAHLELSPDGRFLYASNRGHDSIAVFAVAEPSGALTLLENESTRGITPRDFDVDPNGRVLVVANQESSTVSVHGIEADGTLTALGEPVAAPPSPRAVLIYYPPH